jgi:hypothetical protein
MARTIDRDFPLEMTYIDIAPNVMIEWLTLLLHILEIPGTNLSLDARYQD